MTELKSVSKLEPSDINRGLRVNVFIKQIKKPIRTGNPCWVKKRVGRLVFTVDANGDDRDFPAADFYFERA